MKNGVKGLKMSSFWALNSKNCLIIKTIHTNIKTYLIRILPISDKELQFLEWNLALLQCEPEKKFMSINNNFLDLINI